MKDDDWRKPTGQWLIDGTFTSLNPITCYTCFRTCLYGADRVGIAIPSGVVRVRGINVTYGCLNCGADVRYRRAERGVLEYPTGTNMEVVSGALDTFLRAPSGEAVTAAYDFIRKSIRQSENPEATANELVAVIEYAADTGNVAVLETSSLLRSLLVAIGFYQLSEAKRYALLPTLLAMMTLVQAEVHQWQNAQASEESVELLRERVEVEQRQLEVLESIRSVVAQEDSLDTD